MFYRPCVRRALETALWWSSWWWVPLWHEATLWAQHLPFTPSWWWLLGHWLEPQTVMKDFRKYPSVGLYVEDVWYLSKLPKVLTFQVTITTGGSNALLSCQAFPRVWDTWGPAVNTHRSELHFWTVTWIHKEKSVCAKQPEILGMLFFRSTPLNVWTFVVSQVYHTHSRLIQIYLFLWSFLQLAKVRKKSCFWSIIFCLGSGLLAYSLASCAFFNCLFHFRLLLQLTQLQQSSFVLQSNIKGQKEIDDQVARLGFSDSSLLLMTKVRGCFIPCRFLGAGWGT